MEGEAMHPVLSSHRPAERGKSPAMAPNTCGWVVDEETGECCGAKDVEEVRFGPYAAESRWLCPRHEQDAIALGLASSA